jgi:serine protease AprX
MPLSTVESLSKSGLVNYISPDREIEMSGHIETTTGTSLVRSQPSGYGRNSSYTLDGSGVGIAIVDSGIASSAKSFTEGTTSSRVVYSQSFVPGDSSTNDAYGHGTHVASIAAGSATRNSSAYKGIAPKANLINLKVLNQHGVGSTSSLLQAIEWIRMNRATYNIRVVNMSLGTAAIDSMWNDPLCYAVQDLTWYGILVVAAAGNNGKTALGTKIYGQIHSPANDPSVLTVGATNSLGTDSRSDDAIATYSSHGPTRSYWTDSLGYKHYDHVIKPDIVAPGNTCCLRLTRP